MPTVIHQCLFRHSFWCSDKSLGLPPYMKDSFVFEHSGKPEVEPLREGTLEFAFA